MPAIPSIARITQIFTQAILDFHADNQGNNVFMHAHKLLSKIAKSQATDFQSSDLSALLYEKAWVDTVQWHLEDEIRATDIEPRLALEIKRNIDKLNQYRTDLVEALEELYAGFFQNIPLLPEARRNTETLGWALDRLSILCLKIYHMQIEATRANQGLALQQQCTEQWQILLSQRRILQQAIAGFIADIQAGKVYFNTYKQMKMYNNPQLNPVLYQKTSK